MTLLGLSDAGLCYQLFCYVLCPWREARAVWRFLWWIVIGKKGFSLDALILSLLLGCWVGWTVGIFIGLSQSTKARRYLVLCEYLLRTWVLCRELPHLLQAGRILFEEPVYIRVRRTPRHGKKSRKRRELWFGHAQRCRIKLCTRKRSDDDEGFSDYEDYQQWYWSHRHKFLHVDHYAKDFAQLCRRMSAEELDLVLFGSHEFFSRAGCKQVNWGFLDLTQPLSASPMASTSVTPSTVRNCSLALYTGSQSDCDLPIVFDTGATISVSPYANDFEELSTESTAGVTLCSVTAETTIAGMGTVNWHVRDDSGTMHTIRTKAYLIPNAAARLFSPLVYFQQQEHRKKGGKILFDDNGGSFVFPGTKGKGCLTFHMDNDFPLPISQPERQLSLDKREGDIAFLTFTDTDNTNLTPAQKELLRWHFKLGHVNMAWIQSLM